MGNRKDLDSTTIPDTNPVPRSCKSYTLVGQSFLPDCKDLPLFGRRMVPCQVGMGVA
jgi:hypothetical protein